MRLEAVVTLGCCTERKIFFSGLTSWDEALHVPNTYWTEDFPLSSNLLCCNYCSRLYWPGLLDRNYSCNPPFSTIWQLQFCSSSYFYCPLDLFSFFPPGNQTHRPRFQKIYLMGNLISKDPLLAHLHRSRRLMMAKSDNYWFFLF